MNSTETQSKMWWLNDQSEQILQSGYLLKNETVEDAIHRICSSAAKKYRKIDKYEDMYENFRNLVERGWMSFSSPIWANMGTERGLPISCFNVHIDDNVNSITDKLSEVIVQTKIGGGTSGYFGELRERGAEITNNGKSSGSVSFMQMFDKAMDVFSQGFVRRGSFAAYLDVEHPDIEEFLQIKDVGNALQNIFYGVCVGDDWMNKMIEGNEKYRQIWAKIIDSRKRKGLPYIFFKDNVNKNKPEIYKELDLQINASNLCFTGDTLVCTSDSIVTIKELADMSQGKKRFEVFSANDQQDVWNIELQSAIAFKTGTKEVIEVTLSTGRKFKCTPDHLLGLRNCDYKEAQYCLGEELETFNGLSVIVTEITEAGIEDVYDLTVNQNHNFYISMDGSRESGILVHNCSEIALPSSTNESFICCLSSMNLELYDEWKDTDAVKYAIYFLDAVLQEFIDKTKDQKHLKNTHNFAKRHRALGLGVLGYHSYLQKNMIAFESFEAKMFNSQSFKLIDDKSKEASLELAKWLGHAPIFDETEKEIVKYRNTTLLAIAPTTSSSAILGQSSPGIEPYASNYYKAGLSKGNFMRKNKFLKAILQEKNIDIEEIWKSIMLNAGSVQHLEQLSQHEKDVFKTFREISPIEIITQAAQRQKFIDQSQSLNLNIPDEVPIKDVNALLIESWKLGVKTLYYQRSKSASKEAVINMTTTCASCEA